MTHNLTCPVVSNRRIGDSDYHIISILSKEISAESEPGQFIMLRLERDPSIYLRRPYSICGTWETFEKSAKGTFQLLFKVVGKGTLSLSKAQMGDKVTILGPLGEPFQIENPGKKNSRKRKSKKQSLKTNARHVIVAGGIGSAPFPFLVSSLNRIGAKPVMFYGGRSRIDLPLKNWFRKHCASLRISTEDGSEGTQGLVTDLFERFKADASERTVVYACGPPGMLRRVAEISAAKGYAAYGSFEERMACGFGVCLGCAIPIKHDDGGMPYKHVCKDGPVFDMSGIDLQRF